MNTIKKILLIVGLPVLALAQTNTFSTTTLSSAVATSTPGSALTTVYLASCTNVVAPSLTSGTIGSALYVDRELMQTTAVASTSPCVVQVQRGFGNGTRVTGHATGALVWLGKPDWYSGAAVGTAPSGSCTLANIYAYPDIHVLDGTIWGCRSDGVWGLAGPSTGAYGAIPNRTYVTTTYTATFWDYYIAVNTTGAAFTLTLPAAAAVPGKIYIIQDEGDDAGTNHLTVTTANGCATISTSYGACRVISNGTAWFAF